MKFEWIMLANCDTKLRTGATNASGKGQFVRLYTALCLGAFCALSVTCCVSQELTLVVLDSRNGHPIEHQTVGVVFRWGTPDGVEGTTNSDGIAVIHLPAPISSSTVAPYLGGVKADFWACWD